MEQKTKQFKSIIILSIAIYLGLQLFSCKNKVNYSHGEIERIIVNPENIQNTKLSSFCESISYVNLEKSTNSFIAQIDKVIFFREKLYILDKIGKKLMVFDAEGNHLFNIGSVGKGPGQFINPSDFIIDKDNKQVEIYDITRRKNIIYHLDGKFIFEKEFPWGFIFYEKLENHYIIQTRKIDNFWNSKPLYFDVLFINSDNSLAKKYFKYDPDIKERGGAVDLTQVFTWHKDSLFITKLFNDTTYVVDKHGLSLKPAFIFDFNKYTLPENKRNLKFTKAMNLISSPGKYAFGQMIHSISDSLICYTYGYNNPIFEKRILGLYFRNTNKNYSFYKVTNDIDDAIYTMPITCISDTLISVLYPESILSEIKNKNKRFSTWKENDNPILMLIKIKEPNNQ